MGRSMPQIELAQDVREEVGLAQAVEEAVVRVAPAERPNASDAETSAVIQQVLSELDGAATAEGRATIASGTQPLPRHRLPIVFLDAIEVTQEVQDLDHSVPLIESKPTIVRAYLRYASGPVQVRWIAQRAPFTPRQPRLQSQLPRTGQPHYRWDALASDGAGQAHDGHASALAGVAAAAHDHLPAGGATAHAAGSVQVHNGHATRYP